MGGVRGKKVKGERSLPEIMEIGAKKRGSEKGG